MQTEIVNQLAIQVNIGFSTKKAKMFLNASEQLYKIVQKNGGETLLALDNSQLQCVGIAFATIAIYCDFGDSDINSVAAENAAYCLIRDYRETGNTFVLPTLFLLLQNKELLKQKLIAVHCQLLEEQLDHQMSVVMALGGDPFRSPQLQEFRDQAIDYGKDIQYFVLSKFYDLNNHRFTIPEDIPLFQPSTNDIENLLQYVKTLKFRSEEKELKVGEDWMNRLFDKCSETLSKF